MVVEVVGGISSFSVFSGMDYVGHLSGCYVVDGELFLLRQRRVKVGHLRAEEHVRRFRCGSVGVEFDETPFRAAEYMDSQIRPNI